MGGSAALWQLGERTNEHLWSKNLLLLTLFLDNFAQERSDNP
jgi:hypothetical protein